MAKKQISDIGLQAVPPVQFKEALFGGPKTREQSDMISSSLPNITKRKDTIFRGSPQLPCFQKSQHEITKLPKLQHSRKVLYNTSQEMKHNKITETFQSPTLSRLVTELFDFSDKWRELGIQLGLSQDAITSIEKNHSPYDDRCLINVLNIWLQSCESPSWMVIVKALKSQSVSENGTAVRIYREYLTL